MEKVGDLEEKLEVSFRHSIAKESAQMTSLVEEVRTESEALIAEARREAASELAALGRQLRETSMTLSSGLENKVERLESVVLDLGSDRHRQAELDAKVNDLHAASMEDKQHKEGLIASVAERADAMCRQIAEEAVDRAEERANAVLEAMTAIDGRMTELDMKHNESLGALRVGSEQLYAEMAQMRERVGDAVGNAVGDATATQTAEQRTVSVALERRMAECERAVSGDSNASQQAEQRALSAALERRMAECERAVSGDSNASQQAEQRALSAALERRMAECEEALSAARKIGEAQVRYRGRVRL